MAISTLLSWLLVSMLLQFPGALGQLSITATSSRLNTSYTYTEGSLFHGPFANLGSAIKGSLYYNSSYRCSRLEPPNGTAFNSSILLIDDYSECILTKISFAKLAGYSMILSYTNNDSNFTIADDVVSTGFPFAIINAEFAQQLIENISIQGLNDTSYVTVQGSVVSGVILISFIVIFFISFVCCCFIWVLICCKLYCEETQLERDMRFMENQRDHPSREELIESIMRHLQQLEQDLGAQTPLGEDRTRQLRSRRYKTSRERDTTCAICVEDFQNGERVKELPCKHIFHPICVDEWLNNHSSLCPLCKANIRSDNFPIRQLSEYSEDTSSVGGSRTNLTSSDREGYGAVTPVR